MEREMKWQPIETAPRKGIILCYGDVAGEIHGVRTDRMIYPAEFSGSSDYAGFEWIVPDTDIAAMWMKPSHWMPLPEPPSEEPPNA